ncbi:MAG: transglycosylase SLT domain-containing protein [Chromatiales bacterium]|nr:transglycosylase SLT domain-containing protein [Chromatiales bacterium]
MAILRPGSLIRNQITARYETATTAFQGTLGCFVHRRGDRNTLYFLSVAHVLAVNTLAEVGQAIAFKDLGEPGHDWTTFATLEAFTTFAPTADGQHLDAAIARVTRPDLVTSARILTFDVLPAPRYTRVQADLPVRLHGARSRAVTNAEVRYTGVPTPISYAIPGRTQTTTVQFDDQILYGTPTAHGGIASATKGGDSGALVIDDMGFAVGLHLGVTPNSFNINASVCTPIEAILEHFQLELPIHDVRDAQLPVTVSSAPNSATPEAEPAATTEPEPASAPESTPAPTPITPSPAPATRVDGEEFLERVAKLSLARFGQSVTNLYVNHRQFNDSVFWRLSDHGLVVDGVMPRTRGKPITVDKVWKEFGASIIQHATAKQLPVELVVATICTESHGNRNVADVHESEGRVSVGIMQTLVSTARAVLGEAIEADALRDPDTSIRAGVAYLDAHRHRTRLDPVLVACDYNAGNLYYNASTLNRWRLRQHPIGSSAHADRFVEWFNDCIAYFRMLDLGAPPVPGTRIPPPDNSFYRVAHHAAFRL